MMRSSNRTYGIFIGALIILTIVLFCGCGGNSNSYAGTYTTNDGATLILHQDGSGTLYDGTNITGTWNLTENGARLSFNFSEPYGYGGELLTGIYAEIEDKDSDALTFKSDNEQWGPKEFTKTNNE